MFAASISGAECDRNPTFGQSAAMPAASKYLSTDMSLNMMWASTSARYSACRRTWARVTIDQFRHLALQTCYGITDLLIFSPTKCSNMRHASSTKFGWPGVMDTYLRARFGPPGMLPGPMANGLMFPGKHQP